ncbi:uncharacterized protein N7459_008672 [Penicillium hispanicum]|uniref:uncharacterized protein n=1 Tax=Penicillium hispanicum TaxID=1080232 RepID=UPI0025424041|nr:uncharacterized protein N7459_008672 [Penicillium hispanicum]KAJ5574245.1 hypothetical protein N7459_008672 [Penicillium hispanicum]
MDFGLHYGFPPSCKERHRRGFAFLQPGYLVYLCGPASYAPITQSSKPAQVPRPKRDILAGTRRDVDILVGDEQIENHLNSSTHQPSPPCKCKDTTRTWKRGPSCRVQVSRNCGIGGDRGYAVMAKLASHTSGYCSVARSSLTVWLMAVGSPNCNAFAMAFLLFRRPLLTSTLLLWTHQPHAHRRLGCRPYRGGWDTNGFPILARIPVSAATRADSTVASH